MININEAVPATLEDVVKQIATLTQSISNSYANKQILNFDEAVIFTDLAASYLYKLTSSQEIPHYKPGGKKIYFDKTELENWLRRGRVSSLSEINAKAATHIAKAG